VRGGPDNAARSPGANPNHRHFDTDIFAQGIALLCQTNGPKDHGALIQRACLWVSTLLFAGRLPWMGRSVYR